MFSELSDLQPISKSEMPAAYLNVPNGRMFYQFHTWSLKQINLLRKRVGRDLASKDPVRAAKGVKNLTMLTMIIGSTQMLAKDVKRLLAGDESVLASPENIPSEFVFGVLSNFGVGKWGLEQAAKRGSVGDVVGGTAPAVEIIGKIGMDLGKAAYYQDEKYLIDVALRDWGMGRFVSQWLMPDEPYKYPGK